MTWQVRMSTNEVAKKLATECFEGEGKRWPEGLRLFNPDGRWMSVTNGLRHSWPGCYPDLEDPRNVGILLFEIFAKIGDLRSPELDRAFERLRGCISLKNTGKDLAAFLIDIENGWLEDESL